MRTRAGTKVNDSFFLVHRKDRFDARVQMLATRSGRSIPFPASFHLLRFILPRHGRGRIVYHADA